MGEGGSYLWAPVVRQHGQKWPVLGLKLKMLQKYKKNDSETTLQLLYAKNGWKKS